jgi:hypothetical protein
LPFASWIVTTGCLAKATPDTVLADGCVVKATLLAMKYEISTLPLAPAPPVRLPFGPLVRLPDPPPPCALPGLPSAVKSGSLTCAPPAPPPFAASPPPPPRILFPVRPLKPFAPLNTVEPREFVADPPRPPAGVPPDVLPLPPFPPSAKKEDSNPAIVVFPPLLPFAAKTPEPPVPTCTVSVAPGVTLRVANA